MNKIIKCDIFLCNFFFGEYNDRDRMLTIEENQKDQWDRI